MARAMNIVDVFKVLLEGGHIIWKCPAVMSQSEHKVMVPGEYEDEPDKCVGYITDKQFNELHKKGILDVAAHAKQDKHGNIYTPFCLTSKEKE